MISLLHNWQPTSLIFQIGPLSFHWYGLLIGISLAAGFFIVRKLAKLLQIKPEIIDDLSLWLIGVSILGARIYDVFLEWSYYQRNPGDILKIWQGGMAIHGAIIAGLITIFIFAKKKKINFLILSGLMTPALALGQAIGRWGNWFNQELFGKPTNLPWGIPINITKRPLEFINNQYFHPSFLYESLGNFLIFLILLGIFFYGLKKLTAIKTGSFLLAAYMVLYSILRFSLEFIRIDPTPELFGWRWPQIFSLIMLIGGLSLIIKAYKQPKKNHEMVNSSS